MLQSRVFFHAMILQEEGYLMAMPNRIIFKRKRFFQVLRSSSQRRPRLTRRQKKNPPRGPQKQSEALTSSSWKEFPSALSLELVQSQDLQRGDGKITGSCRANPKQHSHHSRGATWQHHLCWHGLRGKLRAAPARSNGLCSPKPRNNRNKHRRENKNSWHDAIS